MNAKELDQKFTKLQAEVAALKLKFLAAKEQGDIVKKLEVRAVLRAKQKERNYYKKQAKLAKIAESYKE